MGEIQGHEEACGNLFGAMLLECKGHVAGAAAEVDNAGLRVFKDGAETAGGAPPPGAIDAAGEEMVEDVVAGGDVVEHLLDLLCGLDGSERAWRLRSVRRVWII